MLEITRLVPTGDAEVFVLSDAAGYKRKIIISSAQMASDPRARNDAIRMAVEQYHAKAS